MRKLAFFLILPVLVYGQCKLITSQCMDKTSNKVLDGQVFELAAMCKKLGLSQDKCCWNSSSQYYCGDNEDSCESYRKNPDCTISDNSCLDKDYISGQCLKYQSRYSCAGGYMNVESQVCTNVVCASYKNNESDGVAERHSCTPSPYSNECNQYKNEPSCKLEHQGSCTAPNSRTVKCNPYTHECDSIKNNAECQQTKAASCSQVQRITKSCMIQKSVSNVELANSCGNYQNSNWQITSQSGAYACGAVQGETTFHNCNPNTGSCNSYRNNAQCTLTRDYVARSCKTWQHSFWYGCRPTGYLSCTHGTMFTTPGWCGGGAEQRLCNGSNYGEGRGGNTTCVEWYPEQQAQYRCNRTWQDSCVNYEYKSLTDVECLSGYTPSEYSCKSSGCGSFDPSVYSCGKFKCFNPLANSESNTQNMGTAVAYLQLGQNLAQDMECADTKNVGSCRVFSGKYASCFMYMFKADQPGSWNNNGADCGINSEFFTGLPVGYAASDRNLYSQASSGSNNVMGSITNYSLSNDDPKAINNSVDHQQAANSPAVNQDQQINYTPNSSQNKNVSLNNGQVSSVSINKSAVQDIVGISAFKSYLTDASVNLAWNRQKGMPNPQQIKNMSLTELGVTKQPPGKPFGWHSGTNQPIINGLCIHLADSCEGGDDSATSSDLVKLELSWAGGFTNPNFCAKCVSDVFGNCVAGEPRNVKQEWCCFSSKAAMDINIAAYDHGLLSFYTGSGSRYNEQMQHSGDICGGVTVEMISKIDFAKANYFNDLISSIDVNQIVDTTNFTNVNLQNNTTNRSNSDATGFVNEWKHKNVD